MFQANARSGPGSCLPHPGCTQEGKGLSSRELFLLLCFRSAFLPQLRCVAARQPLHKDFHHKVLCLFPLALIHSDVVCKCALWFDFYVSKCVHLKGKCVGS
ncbi:hypothetical protein GOODEAATRI_011189 [Goodea atripinnis]|uniref:Uncharacterized protein n=1 Tax=Goodea atripinnis TaxID=208336 RepID=A0ABV0PMK4_9TELE